MLDGLRDIPWATLSHAYGSAADVPDTLEAVAGGDAEAMDSLFGNIWHQGTVYEATAHAVPFLVELLDHTKNNRFLLIHLLGLIARGSSYTDVHERGARREAPDVQAAIDEELAHVRAAHDAVLESVPRLLRWLAEGDEEVREAVAYVLCGCPKRAPETLPVLELAASRDASPLVRASAFLTMDALGHSVRELTLSWLESASPLERLVAAFVHLRDGGGDPRAMVALEEASHIHELGKLSAVADSGESTAFLLSAIAHDWRLQGQLISRWMEHASAEVRCSAAFMAEQLIEMWRGASEIMAPALAVATTDDDAGVRRWATRSLALCTLEVGGVAETLSVAAETGPTLPNTAPLWALQGLVRLGDEGATLRVLTALESEPEDRACGGLIKFLDTSIPGVVERLCGLVTRLSGNARIAALLQLGHASAIPVLRAHLEPCPYQATQVLGDIGPPASSAVDELRRMQEHEDPVVRHNVARALWTIDEDPAGLVTLVTAFQSGDLREAASALRWLVPLAESGTAVDIESELLREWIAGGNSWGSFRAAQLHWVLYGDAEMVLPKLMDDLQTPRGLLALRTLASMGPAAAPAAQRLREVSTSERRALQGGVDDAVSADLEWRALCEAALAKIVPSTP